MNFRVWLGCPWLAQRSRAAAVSEPKVAPFLTYSSPSSVTPGMALPLSEPRFPTAAGGELRGPPRSPPLLAQRCAPARTHRPVPWQPLVIPLVPGLTR